MRIARIGNLYLPVPPREYGGTERDMAQMTAFQAAVSAHNITIYAASDSDIIRFTHEISNKLGLVSQIDPSQASIAVTNADGRIGRVQLKSAGIQAMGFEDSEKDVKLDNLFGEFLKDERTHPFDIVHCHERQYMAENIIPAGLLSKTLVHQHNPVLEGSYCENPFPLICISHAQAKLLKAKYDAVVYDIVHHGLDPYTYSPTSEHAGYVAWIGRFSANKGADRSIKIARQAGVPLVMAGIIFKIDPNSQRHFDEQIKPHIDIYDPNFLTRISAMSSPAVRAEIASIQSMTGKTAPIIFSGPADDRQKQALYGNAVATLFPIGWPEPFGLVMIESMACGAPVIAYKSIGDVHCGAVAEVIDHGVTGFALSAKDEGDGTDQAAKAITSSASLDRAMVRRIFEQKWTTGRVVRQLDDIYSRFMTGCRRAD